MRQAGKLPVFIFSAGTVGDIYPILRIGLALQARGHAVTFVGPEIHQAHVERAGLPFHSLMPTDEYRAMTDNPELWNPRKGMGVILGNLGNAAARMTALIGLLPHEPCIMLCHPLTVPAAAIARAERPQLRVVTFYLAPANLRTVHDPLVLEDWTVPRWVPHAVRRWLWRYGEWRMIDPHALPGLNAVREQHGLPPVEHFLDHIYATADQSLTLFPQWFAPGAPDWPRPLHQGYFQLYDPLQGQDLPSPLKQFIAAGTPPIVFTPGSGNCHAHTYFIEAQKAALQLGRRAIFLTPYREQVPPRLPDSLFWQDYVPLSALLPHVALLVHHGGIGTTAEALRAGVPQLVAPLAFDQFDNAARVCALGVGAGLSQKALRRGKLHGALKKLLDSGDITKHCLQVAARFAGNFSGNDDEEALCRAIAGQDQIR